MSPLSSKQILLVLLICIECADRGLLEPRFSNRQIQQNDINGRSDTYRGRKLCPKVTTYTQSKKGDRCVSKYQCKYECQEKVQCKTKYEYKCTDFKRQECKNVWQNVCNGKRRRTKRSLPEDSQSNPAGRMTRSLQGPQGPPIVNSDDSDVTLSRVKRLIPTEVVYDQSYPIPDSDLPFASETAGQIFDFASPPLSKSCWRNVRKCEWKKYRSQCRNVPTKACDKKASKVCKNNCKRAYYCFKCPSGSALVTTPKPSVGPPAPPPAGTFIGPPAPPNRLDSLDVDVVDVKTQNRNFKRGSKNQRNQSSRRRNGSNRRRRP